MKRQHFETLRPVCPLCRQTHADEVPLSIGTILRQQDDVILEGVLHCCRPDCRREYPIIDGIPLILADLRAYVAHNVLPLTARRDLSPAIESILGDCCGPASELDTMRQHVSSYAWDHYADLDLGEPPSDPAPGGAARMMDHGIELAGPLPPGPIVDAGCSVGRTTFELAQRFDELVLGVDLNFSMLRLAADVLHHGQVRYPRRRVGLVYDRREFAASFSNADKVDFWACDATALPLAEKTFALALALNVLDSVATPRELLVSLQRVLQNHGKTVLGCPYDWSTTATSIESWLGGHSQRGPEGGAGEPVVRALLNAEHPQSVEGLALSAEADDVIWRVRLHERSTVEYRVHLIVAESV